jgi:hypothetical protein
MLLNNPPVSQPLRKFPTFIVNRSFIIIFTRDLIGPYLEKDESGPDDPVLSPQDPFYYFPPPSARSSST